jgi:hypothetical protein
MEVVQVLWADAHAGDNDSWVAIEELQAAEDEYLVTSVGWLVVGSKPKHITLCQSVTHDQNVDHVLHIPEGMVRKMTVLQALPAHLD